MKRCLTTVLRIALAITFGYAAVGKISDPGAFAQAIENYRILPQPIAVALAFYLPWLEIACGIGLLVTALRAGAIVILGVLAVIFTLAISSALARGLDIQCGCFGRDVAGAKGLILSLIRSLSIVALCAYLWWAEWRGDGKEKRRKHSTLNNEPRITEA